MYTFVVCFPDHLRRVLRIPELSLDRATVQVGIKVIGFVPLTGSGVDCRTLISEMEEIIPRTFRYTVSRTHILR